MHVTYDICFKLRRFESANQFESRSLYACNIDTWFQIIVFVTLIIMIIAIRNLPVGLYVRIRNIDIEIPTHLHMAYAHVHVVSKHTTRIPCIDFACIFTRLLLLLCHYA